MRCLALFLILFSVNSFAGILPSDVRTDLVKDVLIGFWGNARDIKGNPIVPKNDQDRKTVPISSSVVDQAINVGEMSGMAKWCGLAWQPNYRALTSYARKQKMTDKQVAFISVLHGASSQIIISAMKSKTCEKKDKGKIIELLNQTDLNW
jgi:hypothetical protein